MINPFKITMKLGHKFSRFKAGFFSIFKGAIYILKNNLLAYIILPSTLSLLTGVLLATTIYYLLSSILNINNIPNLTQTSSITGILSSFPEWLKTILNYSWVAIRITLSIITSIILYKLIIPITVIPFMGPLLSQIETLLLGSEIKTSFKFDLLNTFRSIWLAVVLSFLGITALLVGLCLGPFDIVLNIVFQSYSLGRGAFDLVFEKQAPLLSKRKKLTKEWTPEILGIGLGFVVLLLIPIIGLIIAPVAATAGVSLLFYRSSSYQSSAESQSYLK